MLAEFPSVELAVRAAAAMSNEYRERSIATGRALITRGFGAHAAAMDDAADIAAAFEKIWETRGRNSQIKTTRIQSTRVPMRGKSKGLT